MNEIIVEIAQNVAIVILFFGFWWHSRLLSKRVYPFINVVDTIARGMALENTRRIVNVEDVVYEGRISLIHKGGAVENVYVGDGPNDDGSVNMGKGEIIIEE